MTKIEDYGFLSDTQTAALVARDGSIDWLCFPRFDSGACFAALLGDAKNGRWLIKPCETVKRCARKYRGNSLILETTLVTRTGTVRLIDFMPPRGTNPDIVRIVEGVRGRVALRMELVIRFDYGSIVPWVRQRDGGLQAIAGPNALILRTPMPTRGEDLTTVAEFEVKKGDRAPFVLTWFPSHEKPPKAVRAGNALRDTEQFWRKWAGSCRYQGKWREAVVRSLVTLKGLTYAPTGGIVAAATTSLPEQIGGVRNWDYRYCWLRDATFTLFALIRSGYVDEARSWREWLLRAIAGSPSQMQIMYGVRGERRLQEYEIPWLSGYENSKPVRIGNAASNQFQLDVYGEVLSSTYHAQLAGIKVSKTDWALVRGLMKFLESHWQEPDEGIWEVRGGRKHFTHSKMMAWVAFHRAINIIETGKISHDHELERWKKIRDQIHQEVCQRGYNSKVRAFTQSYGSDALDASLLMMPMTGFLPATDARVLNTIAAIERDLMVDGLVLRYRPEEGNVDGLPGTEGVFLPCSFWFVNALYLTNRKREARAMFGRLLKLRNDLGLLSEEYDPGAKRQLGNFPQAFSHLALVTTAQLLQGKFFRPDKRSK
ncbi:MAG: glucoamylase [Chthoniobacterales bacterium]|nr:MAG: glucoamylase [Chthoniobacterales bacterium]